MLSIGELSRVTQLTIKALRLYHEKGILIPDRIDYDSKYRYYRSNAVEKALIIKRLKEQYLKGPGMIFRGNPRKYITRLMMFYE
jgi:DNA-binding transcriptional MerR regulator